MALINCPECNKQVSDRAEICIHCGFPLSKYLDEQTIEIKEEKAYPKLEVLTAEFKDGYVIKYVNGNFYIAQNDNIIFDGNVSTIKIYGTTKGIFNKGVFELYVPKTLVPRDLYCIDEQSFEACKRIFADYEKRGLVKKKEFHGIYRFKLNGEAEEVYCPNCKSENCSEYRDEIVVPAKTKTTVSMNLNPLKPFTYANVNEKVVRKGYSIPIDRFICNDCGEIFQ